MSLLITVSQLIEEIVQKQYWFTRGKSTNTAIIDLIELMINNFEEDNTTTTIFLDLSHAFHYLDLDSILAKLERIGVISTAFKWFNTYVSGRIQIVEVKGTRETRNWEKNAIEKKHVIEIKTHNWDKTYNSDKTHNWEKTRNWDKITARKHRSSSEIGS